MRYLQTMMLCCLWGAGLQAQVGMRLPPPPNDQPALKTTGDTTGAADIGDLETLPAIAPVLPPIMRKTSSGSELPPSSSPFAEYQKMKSEKKDRNGDDKNGNGKNDDDKNGDDKDKNGNGKDKDKDKEEEPRKLLPEGWNFHFQTTAISQFDAGFPASYSGPNSLSQAAQRQESFSSDAFFGGPLWHGAEFHADVLLWQGFGLSDSYGLEAAPNAEAYRAGTTDPRFMLARFFVRQTIGLGGEQEDVADSQLTLPGKRDVSRLTITVGRIAASDNFDNNTYNHDPRSQFMSWSSTMLTWDYPADTVGYTTGIVIELNQPDWAVRYGWLQLPSTPNGYTSDDRIFMWPIVEPGDGPTSDGEFWKQWGMILELERRWRIADHPGAVRLSAWLDSGYLASYNQATALLRAFPPNLSVAQGTEVTIPAAAFGFHYKYGFGVNWEQEIAKNVGVFGRAGWQDGQTAAAVYTDVDWTVQLGLSVKGAAWQRPGDTYGFCTNVAGASSQQIAFLQAGGTGILNGDGNVSYFPEISFETYYALALAKSLQLTFDYQFFANPAFNSARGPVNFFATRLHWAF